MCFVYVRHTKWKQRHRETEREWTKNAHTTHIFIALLRDDTIVKLLVFRSIMFMALFK